MTKQEVFKKHQIDCDDCYNVADVTCPDCGNVYCENCIKILVDPCENCQDYQMCSDCEERENNEDYDSITCSDCFEKFYT